MVGQINIPFNRINVFGVKSNFPGFDYQEVNYKCNPPIIKLIIYNKIYKYI